MIEKLIKDITIEYLKDTCIGENLQKAMQGISKVQETAQAYVNDDSPDHLKIMRAGTVAAFAIVSKVAEGKPIKEFDNQDWKDIANKISKYAVLPDGRAYSIGIFRVYANYVDISVSVLKKSGISEKKCDAISLIADEVRDLSNQVSVDKIPETAYTEKCLWLLLEAMIKLIASYSEIVVGEDLAEFHQSVSMLAFEYGRYTLYKQELKIVNQYLMHQEEVDAELENGLEVFRNALDERSKEFNGLISEAFDPDIAKRLMASVNLARSVGVKESEILDSTKKIDDFFA